MNERNGARLRLPASCSLSSYVVLSCPCPATPEGWREDKRDRERARVTCRWKKEDARGRSRRENRLSPNLLTYLAYPGNSRRIHPAPWDNSILESSSLQRDNLWSPLFASLSLCSPPFFPFFPSSRLRGLPFLARRFFPVFSGAALR